jgi:type IV pilus assembly protein PilA
VPTAGETVGKWRCGNAGDGTTVDAKFLPGSCRGQ